MKSRILALPFLVGVTSYADSIIVPADLANADGNRAGGLQFAGQRSQEGYSNSLFSNVGSDALEISELRFRVDPGARAFSSSPEIEVRLSTTARPNAEFLSPIWSQNVGEDEVIALPRSRISWSGNPGLSFDVVVPLPNHFVYTPAKGHLLVDMTIFDGGTQSTSFDMVDRPSDGIGFNFGAASSPTASQTDSLGFVTKFTFQQIPEPLTCSLGLFGGLIVLVRKYVSSRRIN